MKITSGQISSAYNTGKTLVKDEESYVKELENKIETFVTESQKDLKGLTYDALRRYYQTVLLKMLELRLSVKEELEKTNETTNTEWTTFISPYFELDDSEIDSLESQVNTLQGLIDNFDFDDATPSEVSAYYGWIDNLNEIKAKLEKLKLLKSKDSDIAALITASSVLLDKYKTSITSLENLFTKSV